MTPSATGLYSALSLLSCACAFSVSPAHAAHAAQPGDAPVPPLEQRAAPDGPLQASERENDGPDATDLQPLEEGQRKLTDQTVTAGDVATTPVDDLNLRNRKYPPLLLELEDNPYANEGLTDCGAIISGIIALDDILGEDFDIASVSRRKITAGSVGREVVGMLIPFRGLLREASGANAEKHKAASLVMAGMMRRAYLKGLGQQMDCPYPARPADEETRALLTELAPAQTQTASKAK